MTLPDDQIDPREARLLRRVRDYTDAAVVPIDPVALAAVAARTAPRGPLARLTGSGSLANRGSWVLAAGALVAVLVGGAIVGFGGRGLVPVASAPVATTAVSAGQCAATDLAARIEHWEGAAGHRIASVELTSNASASCALPDVSRVILVDRAGSPLMDGAVLIRSDLSIAPGEKLGTFVQNGNYCGTVAQEPVTLVFELGAGAGRLTATPATDGLSGVPDCSGPGQPGTIEMQPWHQAPRPAG